MVFSRNLVTASPGLCHVGYGEKGLPAFSSRLRLNPAQPVYLRFPVPSPATARFPLPARNYLAYIKVSPTTILVTNFPISRRKHLLWYSG